MGDLRMQEVKKHYIEIQPFEPSTAHLAQDKPVYLAEGHSAMARIAIALIVAASVFIAATTGFCGAKVVIVKAGLLVDPYQVTGTGYYAEGKIENVGDRPAANVAITPVCPDYGAFHKASEVFRINYMAPGRQEEFQVLMAYSMVPFAKRPPGEFMKCDLKITFDEAK